MKNAFVYTAIICASVGLTACQDDTKKLLQTIDGQWEVKSILFTDKASRDSTVTPAQAFLHFESCSQKSNGQSPGSCAMQYRIGSKNYSFTYQATDGKNTLYITPTASQDPAYQQVASIIAGSYEILTLAPTALTIRKRTNCNTSIPESCNYIQVTATK